MKVELSVKEISGTRHTPIMNAYLASIHIFRAL